MTNETDLVTNQISAHDDTAKPLVKVPRPFARPLAEILADLSKPIAPQHLKTKSKGGTKFSFLTWYYAVKYLDYYAPGWVRPAKSLN
jgi:hypothetical protein